MVVNAAQLATYSQAKELILGTGYVKVCVKHGFRTCGLPDHSLRQATIAEEITVQYVRVKF